MKQLLTICLYMVISCYCKAQDKGFYMGGSMGLTFSHITYFDIEEKKIETYKSNGLVFAMPIWYQFENGLILESGGLYAGTTFINVMAGYKLKVNDVIHIDIMGGIADAIDVYPNIKIEQKIIPTASIRISGNHLYIHSNLYTDGYLIGIGVKGLIFK